MQFGKRAGEGKKRATRKQPSATVLALAKGGRSSDAESCSIQSLRGRAPRLATGVVGPLPDNRLYCKYDTPAGSERASE